MKQEICRATTGEAILQGMPLFCDPTFLGDQRSSAVTYAMPEPTNTESSTLALIKEQRLMNYECSKVRKNMTCFRSQLDE